MMICNGACKDSSTAEHLWRKCLLLGQQPPQLDREAASTLSNGKVFFFFFLACFWPKDISHHSNNSSINNESNTDINKRFLKPLEPALLGRGRGRFRFSGRAAADRSRFSAMTSKSKWFRV